MMTNRRSGINDVTESCSDGESPSDVEMYGCTQSCTPRVLQCFNTARWFLVFCCSAIFAQTFVVNGLIAISISTWETRFGLSSWKTGIIPAVYELCGLPVLLLIGYFGPRVRRPRWIGLGMALVGVGALVMSLPHFIAQPYHYSQSNVNKFCHLNNTTGAAHLCDSSIDSSVSDNLYVLVMGAMLMSFGSVPLYVLGVACVDDSASKEKSSFYLGIFYSMSTVGPAAAFVGGGFLLQLYTDFPSVNMEDIHIDSEDPRWVGAWWLAFMIGCVMCILVACPLAAYPNYLPGTEHLRKPLSSKAEGSETEVCDDAAMTSQPGFSGDCEQFPQVTRSLFTNATYVFTVLSAVSEWMMVSGFAVFGPKYIENQFSMPAATAGVLFGAIAVPGGCCGSLLGGWILRRWKLSCWQTLRLYSINTLLAVLVIALLVIQCENPRFAGVNTSYPDLGKHHLMARNQSFTLSASCNKQCGCSQSDYDPVCGSDEMIYFTPCYAGCVQDPITSEFVNCTCISNDMTQATAKAGVCTPEGCTLFPLFLFLMLLAMILMFMAGIFHLSIILRCVEHGERPLAISIDWVMMRLIGSFPAPLIFGTALDNSCVLWEEKCGSLGSCLYYDNHQMAWYMLLVGGLCKLWTALTATIAWCCYPKVEPAEEKLDRNSHKGTNGAIAEDRVNGKEVGFGGGQPTRAIYQTKL